MEFLSCLSQPLIQEVVFLVGLQFPFVDCLESPYFIPKGSIPIENHAGHNLAQHAKIANPKWIGVPPETPKDTIKSFVEFVMKQSVIIQQFSDRIVYSIKTDRQLLLEQCKSHIAHSNWNLKSSEWTGCTFDEFNCLTELQARPVRQTVELYAPTFLNLCVIRLRIGNLAEIDLSLCPQLQLVDIFATMTERLNLSGLEQLKKLCCTRIPITTLDLSSCINLERIHCSNTKLTGLDLSHCPKLEYLDCADTNIQQLDVNPCSQLYYLECHHTEIQRLSLTNVPDLRKLYCYSTPIQELDLQYCPSIHLIKCDKGVPVSNTPSDIHIEFVEATRFKGRGLRRIKI